MPTVVSVECSRIEKRSQPLKQTVYWLMIHWSDGSVTESEKSHSALLDFRINLKKNYGDKRGIQIPEVPALKKFELGTASKKDERRKKSVEEFCMQVMKLPNIVGKVNPLMEFLSSPWLEDTGAYSDADLLKLEVKDSAWKNPSTQTKNNAVQENGKKNNKNMKVKDFDVQSAHEKNLEAVDPTTLYAEVSKPHFKGGTTTGHVSYVAVDIQQSGDKNGISSSVSLSASAADTLYAEIAPSPTLDPPKMSSPVSSAKSHSEIKDLMNNVPNVSTDPRVKAKVGLPPQSQPNVEKGQKTDFHTVSHIPQSEVTWSNAEYHLYKGPQYENFPVVEQASDERKLYVVMQSFIPSTSYSQYMAVENGDIVEVHATSGDKVFCSLHAAQVRFMEGWLPRNILKLVPPDSLCALVPVPSKPSAAPPDFISQESQLQEVNENSASAKITKITDTPCFVGSLSRCECEELLLTHGEPLNFIIRESSNLVGQFAISVKHDDHIHHFPIVLTEENKFYIGKHNFKTIDGVITYYQQNDLFVDEDGSAVRLGNPLLVNALRGRQS